VSPDLNLTPIFPWSHHRLLVERAPVRVSRITDLPAEADSEREIWMQMPIRSALTLPVETGGRIRHLIVLNTVHRECEWPDVFVTRLRVFGEILVGALERQEMFAQIRQAEERISLAADSAGAGLWTLDDRTGALWATDRARAIFGYSPDEVIDMERLERSVHPDDWDVVRAAIERSVQTREAIDLEYRIIRSDGSVRWIASSGRPHILPNGAVDCLMGVSIDVSEQRAAQEALRVSEARLASGAELAGLAFYEVHFDQGRAYIDDPFRHLSGLPADREQGLEPLKFWMERLHPDDRRRVMRLREELHDGRHEAIALEYRFLHPLLGERWIEHLARVRVRDCNGRAVSTYGVLRDVTEHRRVEEELRDLSQRLIRAHEEERAMLARELHDDVTQRLAVLAIDVGRVEQTVSNAALGGAMEAIRERLMSLSEDIHSLAYQLHPSVLQELGLVEALRTECERRGRQSSLALTVDLEPLPAGIQTDVALCLFRVAQEALSNVTRHAGAHAASVTLRQMEGGLLLAVHDDGVGFHPNDPGKGRSLGVVSMRERVRLVNGTLDIESAPGKGTTIVAWVPVNGGAP